MFGLHQSNAQRMYVSDGGHYDNLGLHALLRARCAEIWCVDSSADARGTATQLREAIELAEEELRVRIDLPLEAFTWSEGYVGATHVVGSVDYGGGHVGCIVVVKLALTAGAPEALRGYAKRDRRLRYAWALRRFPYAWTFPHQFFGTERFDNYRRLGHWNAGEALGEEGAL
jgi:hypothetical protein